MNCITSLCRIRNNRMETEGGLVDVPSSRSSEDLAMALYETLHLNYPKFFKMDHQSRFGYLASEVVLKGIDCDAFSQPVGLVMSNADGSLDTDIRFQTSMASIASPALFVYTLPSIVAGEICIRHKITGENAFFVTPGFQASLMADYVDALLVGEGSLACLAGWVNVLNGQYDILLYLVENKHKAGSRPHNTIELNKLYGE